ncbi:MAG TPA: glycoside hydrolase family 2 TIM barrel-domain containing protein [Streptosporangiaceae bacterium]
MPELSRRRALQVGAGAAGALVAGGAGAAGGAASAAAEAGSAAADAAPGLVGAEATRDGAGRVEVSFDEGWLFNRGDVSGAEAATFDDSTWRALDLPHDWSIEDLPYATSTAGGVTADPSLLVPKVPPTQPVPPPVIGPFDQDNSVGDGSVGYTIGGIGWYRKHFTLQHADGQQHAELRFDGVYQNADIWLNGVHLGFHPYGYTPFAFDVTPHLNRTGPNVLAVRVDNSGKTSRWYSGSGIYRHTWLTITNAVRIPLWGVYVTTPAVGEQRSLAHVEVSVANLGASPASARVRVTILDRHGRPAGRQTTHAQDVSPSATAVVGADIPIMRAELWSPDSPSLYTARAEVLVQDETVDAVDTTFGVRSLVWDGTNGFQLNGKQAKVVGGCVHDTHGPFGAVALDRTEERRVEILKAAGFNAIRTAHNPPAAALLDAADRFGMLVMDEFTDVWDTGKNPQDYSVHFAQWWQQDLTSMILRDRNHPSIVIWSLGNEIVEDSNYAQRGKELATLLRTLDATRPITLGGGSTFGANDPSWAYVDVGDVHYNANGAGYGAIHAAHPDKAMTQSESFPATIFQDASFTNANAWAVGNWVWAAWDYLGEAGIGKTPIPPAGTAATWGNQWINPGWGIARVLHHSWGGFGYPYPYFQANCGDIDMIGQRKPQNHWRAAVDGTSPVEMLVERPAPAGTEQVAVWWGYYDELASWTWDVESGHPITVHVYTPGDSVTLLLNGSAIATQAVTPGDWAVATFTVPYSPGELTAIASKNGSQIGRTTLRTAGAPAALRLTSDVRDLTTSRDALAHVLVEVIDDRGQVVPDAAVPVTFQVMGAGELAGVANGNPHNVDSFRQPHRYTWHGRALAILRPAKTRGVIRLAASSDGGMRPGTLTLVVRPSGTFEGSTGAAGA